jgi:hypothetical protein
MSSPQLLKRRVMAAKVETTVGTAVTPLAADGVYNVFDLKIVPDFEFEEREGQGSFSPLPGTLGPAKGTATFKTELYGGTSTIPQLFSVLMPACGFVASGDVFGPVSSSPGSNGVTTVTIGGYLDGSYRYIYGAMGNPVFTFTSGKRVLIDWTFHGIWGAPTDVALISPTYPTVQPLRFVNSALSIGGYSPKVAEMTLDFGNEIEMREDSTTQGYISAVIVNRKITGKIDPESTLVATHDWYGIWMALTTGAMSMALGASGNGVALAAPVLQFTKIEEADRNKIATNEIEFMLARSSSAGDDELTFTLS